MKKSGSQELMNENVVMINDRTRIQKKNTFLRENTDQSTKSDGVKSMNMLFKEGSMTSTPPNHHP